MSLDLRQTTKVYSTSAKAKVNRFLTDHEAVQKFARSVSAFTRRLGENAQDDFWQPVLRTLRRVRFDITSVPLPLNHADLALEQSAGLLDEKCAHVKALFPALAPAADALVGQLHLLASLSDDPLADAVESVLEEEGVQKVKHGVLLRRAQYLIAVRDHLKSRGIRGRLLTAEALTGDVIARHIVAMGPRRWFPAYVTTAPRARALTFVHFRWIADTDEGYQAFPVVFPGKKQVSVGRHPNSSPIDESAPLINAEELLPIIDWNAISGAAVTTPEDSDVASASLFLLAEGFGVFLDSRPGARAFIVDPDGEDEQRVRQEPLGQIGPGSFLLLRSEGGGDYIRAIADEILGKQAGSLRTMQREWKGLLQHEVNRLGLWGVAKRLRDLGCQTPSDMNVRYWCSNDSIATGAVADFEAIMKLIGLEDRKKDVWAAMQLIRAAHIRAGQHIRRLLSREVLAANAAELRERGVTHFELGDLGGGTLSVFRVEAKSPEQVTVSRRQLRHPFRVDRDLWHG